MFHPTGLNPFWIRAGSDINPNPTHVETDMVSIPFGSGLVVNLAAEI